MKDWNHDGKIDKRDQMLDYQLFEECCRESGNVSVGGSGGSVFSGTLVVIAVLIVLAVVLGVGIPAAVWGFFIKVILVVGFFTVLSKL